MYPSAPENEIGITGSGSDLSVSLSDPILFRNYVLARLKGENVSPYVDRRLGEQPEDLLAKLYFNGGNPKEIISKTVADILWRAERDKPDDLSLFSRVLALATRMRDPKLRPHLIGLLVSDAPFLSEPDLYKRDLRLHLMIALQGLAETTDPIDWSLFLTKPRYALAGFAGLIGRSLDLALESLPRLVNTSFVNRSEAPLKPALQHLIERFYDQDIVGRIITAAKTSSMPLNHRRYISETLMAIPTANATAKAKRRDLVPEDFASTRTSVSRVLGTDLIAKWKGFSAVQSRFARK